MIRRLKVWWIVIFKVGPVVGVSRQIDKLFRYHVLKVLRNEGVFEFLKQPRTYGQILAEFGFVDTDYTRLLFEVLASEHDNMLVKDAGVYFVKPQRETPQFEQVVEQTDKRWHSVDYTAEGMAKNILPRLRNQRIEVSATFERDGRELVTKFDRSLGNRIFGVMRQAAFALLTDADRKWLSGKKLLDIGCGSGRETVDLWLHLKGNTQITAIDPVVALLDVAKEFTRLLDETDPNHPPVTDANRPNFQEASATLLPFEDNSFDAAFYSQVLHWTPDPRKAISEIVRVVRPGGLIFGAQGVRPHASPYMDLVIRSNENCNGFFWIEEYRRWYGEHGLVPEIVTPLGVMRVRKRE
jgi:ubiquinone/menaquinone biosynthesis C-methylase UbiE